MSWPIFDRVAPVSPLETGSAEINLWHAMPMGFSLAKYAALERFRGTGERLLSRTARFVELAGQGLTVLQ